MRREERVTVQGPVKEQQPDGMSHRGYDTTGAQCTRGAKFCTSAVACRVWDGRKKGSGLGRGEKEGEGNGWVGGWVGADCRAKADAGVDIECAGGADADIDANMVGSNGNGVVHGDANGGGELYGEGDGNWGAVCTPPPFPLIFSQP